MKKVLFVFVFFLLPSFLPAQALDTIDIHRPVLFGIPYRKCMKIWFSYKDGNFSFTHGRRRQDLVITNDSIYYFKVYGYTKKLLLEGRKGEDGCLYGEVKFYYKNGKLKRTEFYRSTFDKSQPDSTIVLDSDGNVPWGTWTYYDKKGRIKKTILYSAENSGDTRGRCIFTTTTRFDKKGKIQAVKKEAVQCVN
jgi:hypothetical protein